MTTIEAITKLTNIMHDDHYAWHPSILTAFDMAVDALKGTGGDYISRKEAIDRIKSHLRTGDELYPLTYADKVVNHGVEIAASCVYNMPSAQPEPKWIPVTERLPEEGQLVLTTIRGTDVIRVEDGETFEDAIDRSRKIVRVSVGFIGSDGWYGVDGYPEIVAPCAWKPLPEPYRKEGAE